MEDTLEEIRSLWEVPTIAHFCSLFREAFKLSDFDIEELEDALLIDGTDYNTILIQQLVINLLKGCLQKNGIDETNYNGHLMDFMARKLALEGKQLEFPTDKAFKHMPIRTKVEILHSLCNYRLDGYDVTDLLKNLESDSLRVQPLGKDESGATYWYFYGTRLYKEVPKNRVVELQRKKKEKEKKLAENLKVKCNNHRNHRKIKKVKKFTYSSDSDCDGNAEDLGPITGWGIVCSTEEDWQELAKKFKNSKSRSEKELYNSISKDFLPEIGRIAQEKEKNLKRRLAEMAPRRVSKRIEVKKQEQDFSGVEKSLPDNQSANEQPTNDCKSRQSYLRRPQEETESIYTRKSREERELDRMKSKDARARRLHHRNEKLLASGGDLLASIDDDQYLVTHEELYAGMYKVIEAMKDHPNSWPFLRPVKDELVPGYSKIIKNPMDMSVVEEKLESQKYQTRQDFESDVMLMLDNCREFNGLKSRYTRMAESLRKVYRDTTEEVFLLENGDDDTYDPTPSKRPARPNAAAALKKTLSAVHKNTAILGLNGKVSTAHSPDCTSHKSWLACRTISSMNTTTSSAHKSPQQSNCPPDRVMPSASLSAVLSNDKSVHDTKVAVKYSVPSIEDFACSNSMLEAAKLGTSFLIKNMQTGGDKVLKLPTAGFHRLPVNIGTSVRSKLAQAKPVQLNLSASGLSRVVSGTLPNGTRALILKPGSYVINQGTASIVKSDTSSPSSQVRTMVLVCTPKKQSLNPSEKVPTTINKRMYSISSVADKISTADGSCEAKTADNSAIPSKRLAMSSPTIQIGNDSCYSFENGATFSKAVRVPVILRTHSGHFQKNASVAASTQGKVPQRHQKHDVSNSAPMIAEMHPGEATIKHVMGLLCNGFVEEWRGIDLHQ